MTSASPVTVRSLRYALACTLAETAGGGGQQRTAEALAELDLALGEAGSEPSDERINLAAGRMLEQSDPAHALQRYLGALAGETAEEGAALARALLERSPRPGTLAAPIPARELDRLDGLARSSQVAELAVLASTLLRLRGRDADALELLERTHEDERSRSPEVVRHLAETRLDLGRVDDTVALVESEDPDGQDGSLQLVRAHALLVRGEYARALELAARLSAESPAVPALDAIAALSLLGLGRLDAALSRLPDRDVPEIHLARAIVHLQRREYPEARDAASALLRARPDDPDVLLVNAQTVVEALGAPPGVEKTAADTPTLTPGAELDAARRLAGDVAAALSELGPRSRWWRAQDALRGHDGPYRFFTCELQFAQLQLAQGSGPIAEDIAAVDRSEITGLQRAALDELEARLLAAAGDDTGAAAAYDAACASFRDSAIDAQRSAECAREAYELVPTVERAANYLERSLYATYETNVDPEATRTALDVARGPAEGAFVDARDDELARLVNVLAWVYLRLNELDLEHPVKSPPELLLWLFAGVALRPTDADLRAALAFQLGNLQQYASAAVEAGTASAAEPENGYVADAALTATVNYFGDADRAAPLLTQADPAAVPDTYRDAVEFHLHLAAGDLAELAQRRDRPVLDDTWAKIDHALATALLDGAAAAEAELADALEAVLAAEPASILEAVVLAAVLGGRKEVASRLEQAERDPETNQVDVQLARLAEQFAHSATMTAEQYVSRSAEISRSPIELRFVVNVMLPLLDTARAGSQQPVPAPAVDQALVQARLEEFEDLAMQSARELERYRPGLSSLLTLADPDARPAVLQDAAVRAQAVWPEELGAAVGERMGQLIVRRACAALPRRVVEARLGLGPAVDPADVVVAAADVSGLALADRLAIVFVDGSLDAEARGSIAAGAGDSDAEAAARVIRDSLAEVRSDAGEGSEAAGLADYWALDGLLAETQDDEDAPEPLRRRAEAVRRYLVRRLDELHGLTRDSAATEIPVVTPIVVEVGDALVPSVDSRQDGGVFLYELIPAMRDRILTGTGVTVPGVRMRGSTTLAPDGYSIQVDEIPVRAGTAPVDLTRVVVESGADELGPGGELTDVHPLTGERGLWALRPAADGSDEASLLSPAGYLIHQIELVFRKHLTRLLGPQEVDELVVRWAEEDPDGFVDTVLPDRDAKLRLTWVLQALVDDGVPIDDWRPLLAAIRDAGGPMAPLVDLTRAVRSRLRDRLPGSQTGRAAIPVPPELEAALNGQPDGDAVRTSDPGLEFQKWLRQILSASGPAITLVTSDEESRERVGALARAEHDLIATLSEDEAAAR